MKKLTEIEIAEVLFFLDSLPDTVRYSWIVRRLAYERDELKERKTDDTA